MKYAFFGEALLSSRCLVRRQTERAISWALYLYKLAGSVVAGLPQWPGFPRLPLMVHVCTQS